MERFAVASPLGSLTVTLDGDNVTRLEFSHSLRNGKITQSAGTPTSPAGVHVAATLETYFACGDLGLLKLSPGGTAFQQRVWEALRAVPAGETATYGELAAPAGADSMPSCGRCQWTWRLVRTARGKGMAAGARG